jgi:murein DD-endopeptidase MepM/ murein hydrolase activator NlpD
MRAHLINTWLEGTPVHQGKSGILSQKTTHQVRKPSLRWLLGISSIPLFGIITAFGLAPQTTLQDIPVTTVVEELTLQALADNVSEPAPAGDQLALWQTDQIRRDDTLATLLDRLNIRNQDAVDFLSRASEASALASQLRPGKSILAKTTDEGVLLELHYQYDLNNALRVMRAEDRYIAEQSRVDLELRTMMKSAEIRSSLFAATDEADIPDHVALQIAEIFSSDIDFHSDLRNGDRMSVVYEAGYSNGEMVKPGQILAVEFTNQGKTYRALLYRDRHGKAGYFTPEGKALQKAFLRSPLEFSRISSGFSLARFHPVLQKWRAHKGVDYAAPTGTRIRATADGTVEFAGVKGGYGNVVILKHPGGVNTLYGHLSRFAAGLRKGQKISQGDVIGHVGKSGLASGPHLHYEFRVNGIHRDPLKVVLPNTATIDRTDLADFKQRSQPLMAQLALLHGVATASLE